MGVIIYRFNLNISPNMSIGVLESDMLRYVTELHTYDSVIKCFVIKRGVICLGPYIFCL